MNMNEVKEKRVAAEAKILEILRELEQETGALVAAAVLASKIGSADGLVCRVEIELKVPE